MTRTAIALGSNLGDRVDYLRLGVRGLERLGEVIAVSSLYETAPIGGPDQGPYLNAIVIMDTDVSAHNLLAALHAIESEADRTRDQRWGPRTLDLDLILYGLRAQDDDARLVLPHPRYHERRFVLEPLLEVWPDAMDPLGRDLAALFLEVRDQDLTVVATSAWLDDPEPTEEPPGARDHASADGAEPDHIDRGGVWVAVQFLLIGATFVASALWRPSLPTWTRIAGVVLVMSAGLLGGAGVSALGRNLTPFPEPIDGGNLVRGGVYGLVRHPIYGAVALAALGWALWSRSLAGLLVALATVLFFYRKAGAEEARLARTYPEYAEYRRSTPRRMIPWIL
jgi:2-amino-4-hydroxy-6-hydroxymethyldihydropteridine diphosphokinase